MAQNRSREPATGAGDRSDRVAFAREVVYDDDDELIAPDEIADALREHGVTVGTADDGTTAYSDIPPTLSLSACHLAVDLRRDPADFIRD